MASTTTVVIVRAIADVMDAGSDNRHTTWCASGAPSTPFAGLFGMGESFPAARQELAAAVLLALQSGSLTLVDIDVADVAAIRVLATTRKTFTVDRLTP